jgi:signal peptidase I
MKTKFELGEKVYLFIHGQKTKAEIVGIDTYDQAVKYRIKYSFNGTTFPTVYTVTDWAKEDELIKINDIKVGDKVRFKPSYVAVVDEESDLADNFCWVKFFFLGWSWSRELYLRIKKRY